MTSNRKPTRGRPHGKDESTIHESPQDAGHEGTADEGTADGREGEAVWQSVQDGEQFQETVRGRELPLVLTQSPRMTREILPPEMPHFEKYYRYPACFSPPECEELIRMAEAKGMVPGTIGNGQGAIPVADPYYRQVLTARITPEDAQWAFDNLIQKATWANSAYQFNLNGLYEDIGIMRYDEPSAEQPVAGHYKWHQDFGGGIYSRRKMSIVGLLSSPADFLGGELHLFNESDEKAHFGNRGDMVMFPSWTPHCVTPLTHGRRYSLVAWVSGPRFR